METNTEIQPTANIPAPIKSPNPLMARFNSVPPETFRMPSGGVFYHNGELDPEVTNGEVMVYPMTTTDEITMRSPDMLFQGTAIEKVFLRCMPQIKKPLDLLSNDVDYLLICLRLVTYGNNLEIYWKCPKCSELKDVGVKTEVTRDGVESTEMLNVKPVYVIDLGKYLKTSRPLNIQNNAGFTLTLSTGEIVKLKPSTFGQMLKLYQYDSTKLNTPEEMIEFILDGLLAVVESINGHTNVDDIREWGRACEAPVLESLQNQIHTANDWGTSEQYEFKCKKCGHESTSQIPLNPVHFFTVPSTTQTKA